MIAVKIAKFVSNMRYSKDAHIQDTKYLQKMRGGRKDMAKWVYMFTEGDASMRNTLGGKGANLAEMTKLGLPVNPCHSGNGLEQSAEIRVALA